MRVKKIIVIAIIFLIMCPFLSLAQDRDLDLERLRFFGYFTGGARGSVLYLNDKRITVQKGKTVRLEFSKYDEFDGVTPDIIDIEAAVSNRGEVQVKDIEVRLSVSPRVAYFVYIKDYPEKMVDTKASEQTAEWFAPLFVMIEKISKLDSKSSQIVVFEKIDLGEIIKGYAKKGLWPTELKVEVSIEPGGQEKTFKNNTLCTILKIPFPSY
jgi:hypothetical protein